MLFTFLMDNVKTSFLLFILPSSPSFTLPSCRIHLRLLCPPAVFRGPTNSKREQQRPPLPQDSNQPGLTQHPPPACRHIPSSKNTKGRAAVGLLSPPPLLLLLLFLSSHKSFNHDADRNYFCPPSISLDLPEFSVPVLFLLVCSASPLLFALLLPPHPPSPPRSSPLTCSCSHPPPHLACLAHC